MANVCFVHLKKTPLFETVIPSKIFEAGGLKRPIIIGVNGEARKLIEENQAGIAIEPESEQQLVNALMLLKENSELCSVFGQNAFKLVRESFDRDTLAEDYVKILAIEIDKAR